MIQNPKKILAVMLSFSLLAGCAGVMAEKNTEQSVPAPEEPVSRTAVDTVTVATAHGENETVEISMDQVPESYYTAPEEQGSLEYFHYATNTYGLYGREEKEIEKYAEVYLPYGYDASRKYNIVYLMHGSGGTVSRFFGSVEEPDAFKNVVDNLIATGEIEPMIFVSLTYYPVNGQDREEDWDAEYTKYFNEELRNDVMPQVESYYSTYAETADDAGFKASRMHRMFAGFSMGGVTTYYRLMDSLDYFHTFMAMSGSLYWGHDATDENFVPKQGFDSAQYIMDAVQASGYTADDFFLYTNVGDEDNALEVVRHAVEDEKKHPAFFHFSDEEGLTNRVHVIGDGEEHSGHATDRYLYNALPVINTIMN
jgi:enterochelin esterase-like enzyme